MPRNPNKIDYPGGFPEGFEVFASIQDPRDGGNTLPWERAGGGVSP